jgi:phosphatidylinositol dimannoside acyltransferase
VWRDYIRYLLFSLIVALCRFLPGRFLYWIALRIADLNYFLFDPRGREAVKANLRRILPDASEDRIVYEARWVFRNFGKYLTEFFRFRRFDRAFFDRHVAVMGKNHIDDALASGKGCLIVSAHLSNWELGAAGMRMLYDLPVHMVVAMHRYGRVNNLFMREREHMGLQVIDMRAAPRQAMRALRKNEVVCMLGDRDPTEAGIEVDFFGAPCRFPQGPARISLATGAPIVPGYILRRTNDSFTIVFSPPIHPPETGDRRERAHAVTQAFARTIEEAIRWHPEEWGVFYSAWEETWKA